MKDYNLTSLSLGWCLFRPYMAVNTLLNMQAFFPFPPTPFNAFTVAYHRTALVCMCDCVRVYVHMCSSLSLSLAVCLSVSLSPLLLLFVFLSFDGNETLIKNIKSCKLALGQ